MREESALAAFLAAFAHHPVAVGPLLDAGERVAQAGEHLDVVEARDELLVAGGLVREDLFAERRHLLGDRAGVGVVLVAAGDAQLLGLRLLDLALLVQPAVVLLLERPDEAGERLAAEGVREGVAARESRGHLPVVAERDVERVVVDRDLPVDGTVAFGSEEVVLERNVGDVGYGLDGHLVFPWVGGPVAVAVSPILHESGAECYKNRAWRGGDPATRPDAAGGG